jgi:hypothetical protein
LPVTPRWMAARSFMQADIRALQRRRCNSDS